MTPSEKLSRYAEDYRALSLFLEAERDDETAYLNFSRALALTLEGARRAAAEYVQSESRIVNEHKRFDGRAP